MTTSLRVLDRVVTGLVAIVLITGAASVIGYGAEAPVARDAASHIDAQALSRVSDWPWWSAALGAVGAVAVLIGVWLLLLHLRPRTVRAVSTEHAGAVDLARLADAAAADLAKHPVVQSAKAATRTVGGRPVVRVTAQVPPATTPALVRVLARRCAVDVRRAADADVEFQLLVKRPAQ